MNNRTTSVYEYQCKYAFQDISTFDLKSNLLKVKPKPLDFIFMVFFFQSLIVSKRRPFIICPSNYKVTANTFLCSLIVREFLEMMITSHDFEWLTRTIRKHYIYEYKQIYVGYERHF